MVEPPPSGRPESDPGAAGGSSGRPQPAQPGIPVQPGQPPESAQPAQRPQADQPAQADHQPPQPAEPVQLDQPAEPVQPGAAWDPGQPVNPGPAWDPGHSDHPVHPGEPLYPGSALPAGYGYGYGLPPGYPDPYDPLVTPPGAGIGGWWTRCWSVVERSWQLLLSIVLITHVLPAVAITLVALPFQPVTPVLSTTGEPSPGDFDAFMGDFVLFLGVVSVVAVVAGLVQCVGWAAATRVIIQHATGGQPSLGPALRYGLRRAPGLWGWYLVSGLIITAGLCACFLPALYLGVAVSLAGPIYLFERSNPIGRSFRMVHARFGMVLGRVAIVVGLVIGGSVVVGLLENLAGLVLGIGATPGEAVGLSVGYAVITLVGAVLGIPFQLAQTIGILLTYTEQRGQEAPVNSAQLAAELF